MKIKRRNKAFALVILMAAIALAGCGTSTDSSVKTDMAMEAAADPYVTADSSTMADFNAEQLEKQNEETEAWSKAPNDMDATEMIEILCDDGEIISASVEPDGIIVLRYINGSNRTWDSTGTYAMTTFTVKLDCIDPSTGKVSNFRTFSSEDTYSCSLAPNGLGNNTTLSLMHFNSDLTQMVATLTLEDGSVHVGWIDESGRFTDVSAMITTGDDFGALINHSNPCFGPGGYFYFRDSTNSNIQEKRVPLSNLTVSAVETLIDDVDYAGVPLYPYPDGTVLDTVWDEDYYYDESMTYSAKGNFFDDWISQSECVGIDGNIIYKYLLSGLEEGNGFDYWYNEKIAIVPEIKGRTNQYPVVSPDGTQVAFLSTLTTGTDTSPYLYTVSVDGGDPVKVSTDYIFDNTPVYFNFVSSFYTTLLLTWK